MRSIEFHNREKEIKEIIEERLKSPHLQEVRVWDYSVSSRTSIS
ncbi:MAG: hypothetical protein QMD80_03295 [archaeon]|nr:hypothetical protein [archaeon]